MIVRVLGSAAGGGVPQWNCACAHCEAARAGRAPRRSQSSLAIASGRGGPWLLLNASPDVAAQIEAFAPLQPQRLRDTPIAGILLTDANLDHVGGLAVLRQADLTTPLRVRSTAVVRAVVSVQPSFSHAAAPPNRWLEIPIGALCAADGDGDVVGDSLSVRALPVAGTTPGYDGRHTVDGAVVAYEIAERESSVRLLFAPVFGNVDAALAEAIASASVAFLDGTFFTDDELGTAGLAQRRARAMGHQPVGGDDGTLAQIRGANGRIVFTHLNNSNPMLDSASAAYAAVRAAGAEIAYDGMELTL